MLKSPQFKPAQAVSYSSIFNFQDFLCSDFSRYSFFLLICRKYLPAIRHNLSLQRNSSSRQSSGATPRCGTTFAAKHNSIIQPNPRRDARPSQVSSTTSSTAINCRPPSPSAAVLVLLSGTARAWIIGIHLSPSLSREVIFRLEPLQDLINDRTDRCRPDNT